MLELLSEQDYRTTPWKNGKGVTQDVLLLPQGASHENFDIRISRAPIVDESQFSPFPGIDRTITRIGDNPLVLRFEDGGEVMLEHLSPYRFDSALAPFSRLPGGATQVLNVMTRRRRWDARVAVIGGADAAGMSVPSGGLLVVHVMRGECTADAGRIEAGETLVVRDVAEVDIAPGKGSACLVAVIEPETEL
ncbi:HutD family protein [Aminobacter aganoensis]|uniref:HutD family protein n=1 Tax=Aminobacter aganoensis TaxID=83264 RepID=A0A7X0KKI5_9HYPH|nr:HutD family protein [Aminobacter aganoensis]MBB6354045.1 hypothetical protein [Aminobacter aganoensis]